MTNIEARLRRLEARARRLTLAAVGGLIAALALLALYALPQAGVRPAAATEGQGSLRVESGIINLNRRDTPEIDDTSRCAGHRGHKNQRIRFAQSFTEPPKVVVGLTTFDLTNSGADLRLWLAVDEVSRESFVYSFTTWCDTAMALAKAQWMAVGQ